MSFVHAVTEGASAWITIWFVGLVFGVSGRYVRRTKEWLLWPVVLVLRTAKRWLQALLKAFVRWIIHHTRHW